MPKAALGKRHLGAVHIRVVEERCRVAPLEHPCHSPHGLLAGLLHIGQRQFDSHEGQCFAAGIESLLKLRE
jgi:hypothetical protein